MEPPEVAGYVEVLAQLRTLTERFAVAAQTMHIGIWDWDVANSKIIWDDTMHALYGVPKVGFSEAFETWRRAVLPEDLEPTEAALRDALAGVADFSIVFRILRPGGDIRHIQGAAMVQRDAQGVAIRMIGVNWDITERQRAEERFRLVVEAAPNAMLMVDANRVIELVNRRTEALFGYTRAELLGQPVELLIPEGLQADHADHIGADLASPQAGAMGVGRDLFGRRKDGSEVPIEIGLNPMETSDGMFTLASVIDITERRRAEDELRRSNADLEQFAYIASHDLQEPLRMVASYTELLAERYRGQLDEKADTYIHYAVDGATRMQQLIKDLLQYSRIGSHGRPQVPVPTEAVVQRVVDTLALAIEEAGATVELGPLPVVVGDASELTQLFQNLISNALKFRRDEPPRVRVDAVRVGASWQFAVADNGIGLDTRFAERIFQMFQRLHSRSSYAGTGIGLSIAKRIVEGHGGRIWVTSTLGVGTTFCFTLGATPG